MRGRQRDRDGDGRRVRGEEGDGAGERLMFEWGEGVKLILCQIKGFRNNFTKQV